MFEPSKDVASVQYVSADKLNFTDEQCNQEYFNALAKYNKDIQMQEPHTLMAEKFTA
jgi:hypothetical protein